MASIFWTNFNSRTLPVRRTLPIIKLTFLLFLAISSCLFVFFYFLVRSPGNGTIEIGPIWIKPNFHNFVSKGKLRIFCAIFTTPANHDTKTRAVRDTWSKRCDFSVYFTGPSNSTTLDNSTSVDLGEKVGREFLWIKTRAALLYIHKNYGKDFDWFLKADDDAYFIMDNLRSYLSNYDPSDGLLLGCGFIQPDSKVHYTSGGAGYAVSRSALDTFSRALHRENRNSALPTDCDIFQDPVYGEDVRLGSCLQQLGVRVVDTVDENGAFRFLPTALDNFVFPDPNDGNGWVAKWGHPNLKQGIDECCHKNLISIHKMPSELMYTFEFLIYHLEVLNN